MVVIIFDVLYDHATERMYVSYMINATIPLCTWNDCVINCFRSKKDRSNREARDLTMQYGAIGYTVHILPVTPNVYVMDNLYPSWNHVETWNTFVIGNDRTYILANVPTLPMTDNDEDTQKLAQDVLNRRGDGILPLELTEFFNPLWNRTLKGNNLQLFIIIRNTTYIVNTFPLYGDKQLIVGAVMFLRFFSPTRHSAIHELMDAVSQQRRSFEQRRSIDQVNIAYRRGGERQQAEASRSNDVKNQE